MSAVGSIPSFVVQFTQAVQSNGFGAEAQKQLIIAHGGRTEVVLKEACESMVKQLIAQKGIVPAQIVSKVYIGVAGLALAALGLVAAVYFVQQVVAAVNKKEEFKAHASKLNYSLIASGSGLVITAYALNAIRSIAATATSAA